MQEYFAKQPPKFRDTAEWLHRMIEARPGLPDPVKVGDKMITYGEGSDGHALLAMAVRAKGVMLYAGAGILDSHAELLGRKRTGKTCLCLKAPDDVPLECLEDIIDRSLAAASMDYGC